MNPPTGPIRDWYPPVKLENTGNPIAPIKIYTREAYAPFFAPSIIPASVIANVCMVMGTPKGRGIAICAMIAMTAVTTPIMHKS